MAEPEKIISFQKTVNGAAGQSIKDIINALSDTAVTYSIPAGRKGVISIEICMKETDI